LDVVDEEDSEEEKKALEVEEGLPVDDQKRIMAPYFEFSRKPEQMSH
jgi:hypothetical protein